MSMRIDRVLLDRQRIAARVGELADRIVEDFDAHPRNGERPDHTAGAGLELMLVPLMTGSVIFVADLMRRMPLMMRLGMVSISSYPGRATASMELEMKSPPPDNVAGRHVIIVDDILDSGRTLSHVKALIAERNPASVRTCVLLDKPARRQVAIEADYVGFEIPDAFVVGYGLDYDGYYRNLPDVCTLKTEPVA